MRFPLSRLACAATLSLSLLAGCAAPLATLAPGTTAGPGVSGTAPAPAGPGAPAEGPTQPQALVWTTVEGQADFRGEPLAHATVRVIDALSDLPAHVISPGGLNYRALGLSEAIAVDAGTLTTDAEGRFRVQVAGLAPGQAIRLVVQAGDNGLSALVTSGQARAAGYRLLGTAGLQINELSSLQAQLSLGVINVSKLVKPEVADRELDAFRAKLDQMKATFGKQLKDNPKLANDVAANTDPKTGGLKKTKEREQLDLALERQTREILEKLTRELALRQKAKDEKSRRMADVIRKVLARIKEAKDKGQLTREVLDKLLAPLSAELAAIDPAVGKDVLAHGKDKAPGGQIVTHPDGSIGTKVGGELGKLGDELGQFGFVDNGGVSLTPPGGKDAEAGKSEAEAEAERTAKDQAMRDALADLDDMIRNIVAFLAGLIDEQQRSEEALLREAAGKQQAEQEKRHEAQAKLIKNFQDSAATSVVTGAGLKQSLVDANRELLLHTLQAINDGQGRPLLPPTQVPSGPPPDAPQEIIRPTMGTTLVRGLLSPMVGTGLMVGATADGTLTVIGEYGRFATVNLKDPSQLDQALKLGIGLQEVFATSKPSSSGGGTSKPTVDPASVQFTLADGDAAGELMLTVTFGSAPGAMVTSADATWVTLPAAKRLVRIPFDAASASDVTSLALPGTPRAATRTSATLFVATDAGVSRVDLEAADPVVESFTVAGGLADAKAIATIPEPAPVSSYRVQTLAPYWVLVSTGTTLKRVTLPSTPDATELLTSDVPLPTGATITGLCRAADTAHIQVATSVHGGLMAGELPLYEYVPGALPTDTGSLALADSGLAYTGTPVPFTHFYLDDFSPFVAIDAASGKLVKGTGTDDDIAATGLPGGVSPVALWRSGTTFFLADGGTLKAVRDLDGVAIFPLPDVPTALQTDASEHFWVASADGRWVKRYYTNATL